jgi:hypothetical protein
LNQRQVVAQVNRCIACRWAADQPQIVGGAPLLEGQEVELVEGKTQITFRSGAIINVVGPARLRLDSQLACELFEGKASAFVPPEATGFALSSGPVKVVDRGTEFTLRTAAADAVELFVHLGFVDVEMEHPPFQGPNQLRAVEQRAYHFDCRAGEVESMPFDDSVWVPIDEKR